MKHPMSLLTIATTLIFAVEPRIEAGPTYPPGGSPFHYVSPAGSHISPFATWDVAATNIQDAVDACADGHIVFVTNGHYVLDAEIAVGNEIYIQSENGPEVTIIDAGGHSRCFNLGGNQCVLSGFTIQGGYHELYGGGVYCDDTSPVVSNCVLRLNQCAGPLSAGDGAGMFGGTAVHCVITNNSASSHGGGLSGSIVINCVVANNRAHSVEAWGGGVHDCEVRSSTIVGNYSYGEAGGAARSVLFNSIISGNYAEKGSHESQASSLTNCYTGNLSNVFVDRLEGDFRLAYESPCVDTGGNEYVATANDLDGNPRIMGGTVDIGAYESTPPNHYVSLSGGHVFPFDTWPKAATNIQDAVDACADGHTVHVTNGTYLLDEEIVVDKAILMQSVNGPAATHVHGDDSVRCFNLGSSACVVSGFGIYNGETSGLGGGVFCLNAIPVVTNCSIWGNFASRGGGGMYGGTAYDCSVRNNSSWGPDDRYHGGSGGGLRSSIAFNCVIDGNEAYVDGGGVYGGLVYNCVIRDNECDEFGGGVYLATAIGCVITGNTAWDGGGMVAGEARNCTIYGNFDQPGVVGNVGAVYITAYNCIIDYVVGGTEYNTCSPYVAHGVDGNITNAPIFINVANGDYRLQSNSPCINWGNNAFTNGAVDLDGNPRVVESYVDMGCYEYQNILGIADSDGDGLPDEWEHLHFGGNADPNRDDDGDGHRNWQELISGMDPMSGASVFAITNVGPSANFVIEWPCVEGRYYSVYYTLDLMDDFKLLESNLVYPRSSYTDVVHSASARVFYEVRVSMESYVDGAPPADMILIEAGSNSGTNPLAPGESFGSSYPSNYALVVDEFYMDPTEVTKEQWDVVYNWAITNGYAISNTGVGKGAGHPVRSINWYDTAVWCNARSAMDGRISCYNLSDWSCDFGANGYRLPTCDEWQYAARGGLNGKRFPWGDTINHANANYLANGSVFSYDTSGYSADTFHPAYKVGGEPYTSPEGSFPGNGYGILDMAGGVWEWCNDSSGANRGMLGGSYGSRANWVRCGVSNYADPATTAQGLGFRAVCRP